jgi:hypothetical protein
VAAIVGAAIMAVFLIRMKRRQSRIKKNQTKDQDKDSTKMIPTKDKDVEEGAKYTSISTGNISSNTSGTSAGTSGNYNEISIATPLPAPASPGIFKLNTFVLTSCRRTC